MDAAGFPPRSPLSSSPPPVPFLPKTPYGDLEPGEQQDVLAFATQIARAAYATKADEFMEYLRGRIESGLLPTATDIQREFDFVISQVDCLDPARVAGLLQSEHARQWLADASKRGNEVKALLAELLQYDLTQRLYRDLVPRVRHILIPPRPGPPAP
jgi:hypothetical protein